MKKLYKSLILLLALLSVSVSTNAQVAINTTGAAPDGSAMLDIKSADKGILIPHVTLTAVNNSSPISSPANGLMVFHNGGNGMQEGFYFWSTTDSNWKLLYSGNVPSVPGNTVYWVRPTGMPYIQPEGNDYIRVNDAGETYGIYYDGSTNQYGIYSRTTDGTGTTAAVVGFSDVTGNQTYGYLGYNGDYTFSTQTIHGSSVYGVAEDPARTAGFFRSTSNASVAANIAYSDVWFASYNYVENSSDIYNPGSVYGYLENTSDALGGNQTAVKGYSEYNAGSGNTGYTVGTMGIAIGNSQDAVGLYGYSYSSSAGSNYIMEGSGSTGIVGFADHSGTESTLDAYMFGVIGEKYQDWSSSYYYDERSGGVLGTMLRVDNSSIQVWGSLAYKASNATNYGVYYSANSGSGGGKSNNVANGIGMGGTGDLMGGWIRGDIYGLAVKGDRYGLYVDGKQYNNNIITQLSDNGSNDRIATYVPTSSSVDIITRGTATLSNGKATIVFDKSFSDLVSSSEPIVITVTPQGKSNGVYVQNSKSTGFQVVENNDGKSTTTISWIAIGTKKGYETPTNPVEIITNTYDQNMDAVMFNESDVTKSAKPIWWDGTKLRFDDMPKSIDLQRGNSINIKNSNIDIIKTPNATKDIK